MGLKIDLAQNRAPKQDWTECGTGIGSGLDYSVGLEVQDSRVVGLERDLVRNGVRNRASGGLDRNGTGLSAGLESIQDWTECGTG